MATACPTFPRFAHLPFPTPPRSARLRLAHPNLTYQGHPITIENLANHTAGLPKFLPRLDPSQTPDQILATYPDISGAQLLSELSRFTPDTLPGTKFIY